MAIHFAPTVTPLNISNSPDKKVTVLKSKVPISHLRLSSEQHKVVVKAYQSPNHPSVTDVRFDYAHQAEAHKLLMAYKLDSDSLKKLFNKWCVQWSTNGPKEKYRHTLYQCCCGYDHKSRKTLTRRIPYDFTGCLAHVEIVTVQATGHIARVHGMLQHHQECIQAKLNHEPKQDLHPSVFEVHLQQLNNGASLTEIKEKNRAMVAACQYRGQKESLGEYRFLLRHYDTATLYAQYYREHGIDIKEKPHLNIHNWLDPSSKTYNPTLARAIFHYSSRTNENERFEVCIATDEMKEAAWRYGHKQQILVDGTFGVCDRRILLFIIMGIDEQNHGVPLAFLLFSAPGGNKATQSGYDTAILIKVISRWKDSLSLYRQHTFSPAVAITDTDFKERGALLGVFPGIKLLICRFHLHQSWSNHRVKCTRGHAPGQNIVQKRLVNLEHQLVESTSFDVARGLINNEINALNQLASNGTHAYAAGKGLTHIEYLSSYWVTEALWKSWSERGRMEAAEVIGVAIQRVVMTNNHLESFNGLLKHGMLKGWSRGGRRIRVDVLVFMLAMKIAPSIFLRRRLEQEERNMLRKALEGVPGADELFRKDHRATNEPIEAPVAYLAPDVQRDNEAHLLHQQNRLSNHLVYEKGIQLTCWSTQSTDRHGAPIAYSIWLGFDRVALCTCPDFQQRGGACKHMRAALLCIQDRKSWVRRHQVNDPIANTPDIELPTNKAAAIHAIATRFGSHGRNTAPEANLHMGSGLDNGTGAFARAARCVNEALEGGFLGDIGDQEGEGGADLDSLDERDAESLSEEDIESWFSGDELYPPSTSARGLAEQVIARTTYNIQQQLNMLLNVHAALDHITPRDIADSLHRAAYEQYANELEALVARVRSLLRSSAPLVNSSQRSTQPPTPSQLNTRPILLPPSPEKRQYRKNSRSFH